MLVYSIFSVSAVNGIQKSVNVNLEQVLHFLILGFHDSIQFLVYSSVSQKFLCDGTVKYSSLSHTHSVIYYCKVVYMMCLSS